MASAINVSPKHFVIIDNDLESACELKNKIEEAGPFLCQTLNDRDQALSYNEYEKASLVLLALDFGGKSLGAELARKLSQQKAPPVIFLTTHLDDAVIEAAEKADPLGYLPKNADKAYISAVLRTALKTAARRITIQDSRQNLQQKEDFTVFHTIFENAPIVMMLVNSEGRVENINRMGAESTGKRKEELLGLLGGEVFDCINSFQSGGCGRGEECAGCPVRTSVNKTFETGSRLHKVEGQLTILDNGKKNKRFFYISTIPIQFPDGPKVLVSMDDYSDKREADEKIRNLQRQTEFILGAAKTGLCIIDADFRIRYIDPGWSQKYGPVNGRKCHEYIWNLPDPCPDCKLKNGEVDGGAHVSEKNLVRENGRPVQVTTIPFFDQDGEQLFAEVHVDISERKKAEKAIQESEAQQKLILDSMQAGVVLIDAETRRIVHVNEFAAQTIGRAPQDIIGQECTPNYCPLPPGDCPEDLFESPIELNRQRERYLLTVYGEIPIQMNVIPIKLGERRLFLETFTDISELKRIEEELKRSKIEAEKWAVEATAASQAKSIFLANMSHEIRTPMNAIMGMIELTLQDETDADHRDNLMEARNSARILLSIINNILDLSKIEAGRIELDPVDFDLHKLIGSVIKSFEQQASAKKVTIEYELEEFPACVRGDSVRLRQILGNLIGNAIKFTSQGVIMVKAEDLGSSGPQQARTLRFTVKDPGIGIAEEQLKNIFENFRQAESSTTRRFGGAGLGLAISKQLVELMNGRIWVESSPGTGSSFFFEVELHNVSRPAGELDSAKAPPSLVKTGRSLKILLADDNLVNAAVAEKFLTRMGHAIGFASNGKEVLDMLSNENFDLVLMDLEMPVMDGTEAASRIRASESGFRNRDIPIIAITAHAFNEFKDRCEQVGMNGFITKPIDFSNLQYMIETIVPGAVSSSCPMKNAPHAAFKPITVVDIDQAVYRLDGDEELYWELTELFIEDFPQKIEDINAAADAGAWPLVARLAHTIKGSAGAVGAIAIQEACKRIELAVKSSDPGNELKNLILALEQDFEATRRLFSRKA